MKPEFIVQSLLEDDDPEDFIRQSIHTNPRQVHVSGRRWHRPRIGGVYHTAEIYVDGRRVGMVGPAYGYGEQYEETATKWLEDQGIIQPRPEGEPPWSWYEKLGIDYTRTVYDVKRQRDLIK